MHVILNGFMKYAWLQVSLDKTPLFGIQANIRPSYQVAASIAQLI